MAAGHARLGLIGLDAAYAAYEMGLENDRFVESVRGVWSQFLVEGLCPECAAPARLSPAEMDYLFPGEPFLRELKVEVGCPACAGKGTAGRTAVCEVLVIGDPSRPAIARALLEGTPLRLAPEWHLTAQEHARQLVARGEIGVGTYRDAIRRNPLLRAQNLIEREQSRAFKLDAASRHKSEFLANMSHELRTPFERRHRLLRGARERDDGAHEREAARIRGRHPRIGKAPPVPHQRHPGPVEDRGRKDGARPGDVRPPVGAR
jgi:signal transduction histidine kinase